MCNDQPDDTSEIRLSPPAPKPRARTCVRRAWGRGLLSGLPFAEVILLAGFLMSAGMFLTIDHGHATTDAAASVQNAYTR
ncbi:hypothetical protein XM53_08295 [Roseovarius atlanticus]|uniref:Uncharacterized protein n=1 Tax=Roseovarius atlanticus TaxID=1641875 RepID=A0A0T5NWA4_9RHOB|nr:hypothetical protein [Roseovarius atlanticus]KRS13137.1 hypothetical protein XM53_08295 [Roseovarius atlanticus]